MFVFRNFIWPPLLTCIVEIPIIYFGLKLKNIPMIAAVNVLTNVLFSSIFVFLEFKALPFLWWYTALMEIFVIPISEALLYNMIVERRGKCFVLSYIANACSFGVGMIPVIVKICLKI